MSDRNKKTGIFHDNVEIFLTFAITHFFVIGLFSGWQTVKTYDENDEIALKLDTSLFNLWRLRDEDNVWDILNKEETMSWYWDFALGTLVPALFFSIVSFVFAVIKADNLKWKVGVATLSASLSLACWAAYAAKFMQLKSAWEDAGGVWKDYTKELSIYTLGFSILVVGTIFDLLYIVYLFLKHSN